MLLCLPTGGGGTPSSPDREMGTPILTSHLTWIGGYPRVPPSTPGMGYPPSRPDIEVPAPHSPPPILTWDGGISLSAGRMDYPHPPPSAEGVPPPTSSRCGLTHKVKILPSPILKMQAVISISLPKKHRILEDQRVGVLILSDLVDAPTQ